jgi:hypothetical protein
MTTQTQIPRTIRCAIYTRKSSEEVGLNRDHLLDYPHAAFRVASGTWEARHHQGRIRLAELSADQQLQSANKGDGKKMPRTARRRPRVPLSESTIDHPISKRNAATLRANALIISKGIDSFSSALASSHTVPLLPAPRNLWPFQIKMIDCQ